jgi:hypothetical protein
MCSSYDCILNGTLCISTGYNSILVLKIKGCATAKADIGF